MNFTFDLIFSYWLDAWFIAWVISDIYGYASGFIPNPAIFLALGLAQNWWFLSRMFHYNIATKWLYLGQSVILKLLPLSYAMYRFPLPPTNEIKRSWIFGIGVIFIYSVYLYLNVGTDPVHFYLDMNKTIISGEIKTPFMRTVMRIRSSI